MKKYLLLFIIIFLVACGRSKEPMLYVLNPLFPDQSKTGQEVELMIGIDDLSIPDYLNKAPLSIYSSIYQSQLDENHHWAESIDNNIKRVIRTNLSNLITHAAVDVAPYGLKFRPDIRLVIHITQFRVDLQGNSVLHADFEVREAESISKKYTMSYFQKIKEVNATSIVSSMNNNLNRLTRDMAYRINMQAYLKRQREMEK